MNSKSNRAYSSYKVLDTLYNITVSMRRGFYLLIAYVYFYKKKVKKFFIKKKKKYIL